MRYLAYLVLLLGAAWLNRRDRQMLMLTAVVGISVFIPAPSEWPTFYYFCAIAEITVALVALGLNTAASIVIAEICVVMVISHAMGYYMDGYLPFSPYRSVIKILETSEILCCILASAPISALLRNREPP